MKLKPFEQVYEIVKKIPQGKIATYGQIATFLQINPRVVGFALRSNKHPEIIPCHRVVSKMGKLTGYAFGGIIKKKEILEKEGITFLDDTTVNLPKHLFTPSS